MCWTQNKPTKVPNYIWRLLPYLQNKCFSISGFQEGTLPFTRLGVPITASRLTKIECPGLVDKMAAQIQEWSSRNISYPGRVKLINTVIFGMVSYWASIHPSSRSAGLYYPALQEFLMAWDNRVNKGTIHILENSFSTKESRGG